MQPGTEQTLHTRRDAPHSVLERDTPGIAPVRPRIWIRQAIEIIGASSPQGGGGDRHWSQAGCVGEAKISKLNALATKICPQPGQYRDGGLARMTAQSTQGCGKIHSSFEAE